MVMELRNNAVRVSITIGTKFNVEVEAHQESVQSHLLLVIALKTLSREFRHGILWKMLHTDDLVIIAESREELEERYLDIWHGLNVNIETTKIMKHLYLLLVKVCVMSKEKKLI